MVVLDQLSKWWATSNLSVGERHPILGDALGLMLTHNPGAAFSLWAGATWILSVVTAVAVLVIGWFAVRARSIARAVLLGLLLGGAVTHLADRLFRAPGFGRGEVVDFIEYGGLFIGNVADIVIVGSVIALLALRLVEARRVQA